jgi:hypothetical protein
VHLITSDQLERALRAALYRFDCATPNAIGEYCCDFLVEPERRGVAEHLLSCVECADELRTLRTFLASDPPRADRGPWRRVLAALITPASQLVPSPVRGGDRQMSCEYHAGPVHMVLGLLPARRRGTFAVDGLVLHDNKPEAVAHRDVTLLAGGAPVHATRTDDLGNFAFEAVAAGTYSLEIAGVDVRAEVIVIENLIFGDST